MLRNGLVRCLEFTESDAADSTETLDDNGERRSGLPSMACRSFFRFEIAYALHRSLVVDQVSAIEHRPFPLWFQPSTSIGTDRLLFHFDGSE